MTISRAFRRFFSLCFWGMKSAMSFEKKVNLISGRKADNLGEQSAGLCCYDRPRRNKKNFRS